MRNTIKTLLVVFSSLFLLSASAQTYTGFSDITVTLKSDSTTRSALISNLLADRVGDLSPIIGVAAWTEQNKKLQCRSLLSFDYGLLPHIITPEQVTEAILILKPVEILTVETMNGTSHPKFTVRRVIEPWEDSTASWLTQPAADEDDAVRKTVSDNKKWKAVRIDVTDMVKEMLRKGNNGFMISYEDSLQSGSFLSQWFASAKYDDAKYRPELSISWSVLRKFNNNYDWNLVNALPMERSFNRNTMQGIQQMPVISPVTVPPPKAPDQVPLEVPPPRPKGSQ